jgi:catechol 2,3-dioxygenase-like lactoylglutathione lyase family enzyme
MPLEPLRPMVGECQPEQPTDPGVRIGHVHLKVADLERALAFYCGMLGFELMQRYGTEAAFIAAGGYHHHIGLNTWESRGGSPPPPGSTSRQVDAIEVRQHARDHRLIRSEDDQHVCSFVIGRGTVSDLSKNQATKACRCCGCGHVGKVAALSKRSVMSTALASRMPLVPARHTAMGACPPNA